MKYRGIKIMMAAAVIFSMSCKKYLDYKPQGALAASDLTSPEAVDGLCTAAYAGIANDFWDASITSMWQWGSIRSDDAYKGGGDIGDQQQLDKYEQFYLLNADNNGAGDNGFTEAWIRIYGAISRINAALRALNDIPDADFPKKTTRIGEMHFLRGHMFFLLKILFRNVPYFDETVSEDDILKVSNTMPNDSLWEKIAGDFQVAINDLPETQTGEPGRATKYAAEAYLAKVRLYEAYKQDDNYTVTSIDADKLQDVVNLTDDVINSGLYKLNDDFAYNFLYGYENGPESIFAIQYSINDGTQIGGRLSMSTSLNYFAGAPQYGCCAFHVPSQNMVNAFQTDANGLPEFTTFNGKVLTDADLRANGVTVDPRIDHTIGIQGHPFKYDAAIPYDHSWERLAGVYGGFGTMKELQLASCPCFKKLGPFYGTSVNMDVIRYDDVLLMKAEAEIQLNNPAAALPLINQVRGRAAQISPLVKKTDGTYPSNYKIDVYKPGVNIPVWDKNTAFTALQWERRMEFAMEGYRFFDLVRWGIAEPTLNNYFAIEKTRHPFLSSAHFTHGTHEYFPIPQEQITFTNGLYKQNHGY
ncbi:RagB/SusD family nutrient uptake outer membrane protein [Parafilimonas sp.]|uniref:RagB/SusD family nutrient uptake outer membrane protein n=1 Tax=Parafilimonas sp. TaxID=1969739 RepID=UPI003F81E5CF